MHFDTVHAHDTCQGPSCDNHHDTGKVGHLQCFIP